MNKLVKVIFLSIFALIFFQSANAQTYTQNEQNCFNMVQGKVAWNQAGTTTWGEGNLRNLCQGTTNPSATISCFQNEIRTHNDWSRGISACKSKTTSTTTNTGGSTPAYQKYIGGEPRTTGFFSLPELKVRMGATSGSVANLTVAEQAAQAGGGNEKNLPFTVDKNYPDFYFIPSEKRPRILDQGSCGSCVAWSSSTALASVLANEGKYKTLIPGLHMPNASLFFITNGRMCKDTLPNYAWDTIPGVKSLTEQGTFMALVEPASKAGDFGSSFAANVGGWIVKAKKWGVLTDKDAMRKFIVNKGALVADFTVTEDFNKYESGIYNHNEFITKVVKPLEDIKQQAAADQLKKILKTVTGGHAVTVIGYFKGGNLKVRDFMAPILPPNSNLSAFGEATFQNVPAFWIVQNSWGTGWGMNGIFYVAANQDYNVYRTDPKTKKTDEYRANTIDNEMFYMLEPKVTNGSQEIF